jgi:chromosome condensin MukBEF MukE localization factor
LVKNQENQIKDQQKKLFSEKVLFFYKNIHKEKEAFEFSFEREKIRFHTLSNKQLININEEFYHKTKEKGRIKRSKILPLNLIEILNKDVLCFWFLGAG